MRFRVRALPQVCVGMVNRACHTLQHYMDHGKYPVTSVRAYNTVMQGHYTQVGA